MKVEIYSASTKGEIIYGKAETIIKKVDSGKSLFVVVDNVLKYIIRKQDRFGNVGKYTTFKTHDLLSNQVTEVDAEDIFSHPIYKEITNGD
jgi:hypothetical protein